MVYRAVASNPRLSPTSYLVLGMVALRGPTTPYELKRAVGRSVGYFWRFPHTQLYEEPARLADAGLLFEDRESNGRRRRTYTVTAQGLEVLRSWLREPASEHFQLRDIGELKLFFSEMVEPEAVERLAREQVRIHEERLEEYEKIHERFKDQRELANRMAPLDLGLELERAALKFWVRIAQRPPRRTATSRRSPRGKATQPPKRTAAR